MSHRHISWHGFGYTHCHWQPARLSLNSSGAATAPMCRHRQHWGYGGHSGSLAVSAFLSADVGRAAIHGSTAPAACQQRGGATQPVVTGPHLQSAVYSSESGRRPDGPDRPAPPPLHGLAQSAAQRGGAGPSGPHVPGRAIYWSRGAAADRRDWAPWTAGQAGPG